MTIKKRLLLNAGVTILGIAIIGAVSVLGLATVKEKVRVLTTKSTPFQLKTLELTKQLQEHAVNLFAVSSSTSRQQLDAAAHDAEDTLNRIARASSDLRSLQGEKSKDPSSILEEATGLTKEMIATAQERIRTEDEASEAVSLSRKKLTDTLQKLNKLQQSMKELQNTAASNLTRSSRNSRRITAEMAEIQKIKDSTQELQTGLTEIHTAPTIAVVNAARGRIRFALQGISQSGQNFKTLADLSNEFGKMAVEQKGLADIKDALLAGPLTQKMEEDFRNAYQRCRNKLDNVVMQVSEALDGVSLSYQAENIALDGTIKASEGVHEITVLNNEMVNTGFTIQNLVTALFSLKTSPEIEAAKNALLEKFVITRQLAGRMEKSLSTAGKKSEAPMIRQVASAFAEINGILAESNGVADKLKRTAEARVHSAAMNAKLAAMIRDQKEKGGKTMASAHEEQTEAVGTVNFMVDTATTLVIIIGIAVLIAGFAFSRITARSIMGPVESLTGLAEKFGNGDFSVTMDDSRRDEFAAVAANFNRASAKIREMAANMGNLSDHLFASSHRLTSAAEELSLGSERQTEGTEKSAAAIAEMSQTNAEMVRNTRQLAERAAEMKELALKGNSSLHTTSGELYRFSGVVDAFTKRMDGLSQASQNVRGISDVIQDIAHQTNLLALNAAIEAARAGEAGKGFAVVADNVRSLSDEVSSSAKRIDSFMGAMLGELKASVESVDEQKTAIGAVLILVRDTGNAMDSIVQSVEYVSDMVEAGAVATEQHSLTSRGISDTMEKISLTNKDLNRSIGEIENQAKGLVAIAHDLDRKVKWFKTDADRVAILREGGEKPLASAIRADAIPALPA